MSLFSTLNIGTRGLSASQIGMEVTGQNISNADVEGYSRKRINMAAEFRYDPVYLQVGMGVNVINIERQRDAMIDEQIRNQNQNIGTFEQYDYTLQQIENLFNEPGDTGLLTYLDRFFDSWQNLANNPEDVAARTVVKTQSQVLIDKIHSLANGLENLRQTRNSEITQDVNQINQLVDKISNLNKEISAVEITTNQKANDSRDQRDEFVKQLAKLIDIQTIENERGQISITTGGSLLVSPIDCQKLETFTTLFTQPDGTQYTQIGVRFADSKRPIAPTSGEIKGLFDSRDVLVPQYQRLLDTLSVNLVQKVNELHVSGYTLHGYTGIPFFNPVFTGASDIALSPNIEQDLETIAAASGGEQFPAVANTSAAGTHTFGAAPFQLVRDPATVPPVPATNIVQGTVTVSNGTALLTEDVDYHIDYVLGTVQMLHAGYNAANLTINFQYRTGGFNGPGDNTNAIAIASLRDDPAMNPDTLGNPTSTFTEYYSALIGRLGTDRNAAKSNLDTRTFLITQYEAQQDAIAGVSLDEEMANMIKYQHTYQAAAHVISITDQMLDVLMNM